jgi:riboflavin biosynthesis pyrimidine reductase
VRRLLPSPSDQVDLLDAYAPPDPEPARPFVRCNMISSIDGAIAVEGRSGMLGGPADRRVFATLRSLADVIVVGAGTVRAEGYGPARLGEELRSARESRGQAALPPIAVVTSSAHLDWSAPFFTDAGARPLILTSAEGAERAGERARMVADVVVTGRQGVDLPTAVGALHARGLRHVLGEGGPALNAELTQAGLLDELCLTVAPRLVGGAGPRVLAGEELRPPVDLEVVQLLEEDGFLFYRLRLPRRG